MAARTARPHSPAEVDGQHLDARRREDRRPCVPQDAKPGHQLAGKTPGELVSKNAV
eukprot:SAG22_NODE_9706_length_574_cov_0.968421_1_plen_55_part_10